MILYGKAYNIVPYQIVDNSMLHVLLGYETFVHRKRIKKHSKFLLIGGLLCFFTFNIQRYYLQTILFKVDLKNDYFLHIDSLNSFLSSYALFITLICLPLKESKWSRKIILSLSSKTFGIYIIHRCVYEKMNNMGVRRFVYSNANKIGIFTEILCTVAYALIVFAFSFVLVTLIKCLTYNLKKIYMLFTPTD